MFAKLFIDFQFRLHTYSYTSAYSNKINIRRMLSWQVDWQGYRHYGACIKLFCRLMQASVVSSAMTESYAGLA